MALIEYNDPVLLIQAIERTKTPAKFLVDTFFPTSMPVLNSDRIMVEMRSGQRRLAPYAIPGTKGVNIERDASSFKFYRPPMVAPRRVIDPEDLRHREFGETIYSQMTEAQRAAHIMNRDLSYLKDTIQNRKNQMAAEILTTGKCEIKGYADDGQTVLAETIDFGWTQKVIPATTWDNPSATIYDDIMNTSKMIQRNANEIPKVMLCGENVERYLMKNTEFKDYIMVPNRDNLAMLSIAPRFESPQIRRIGLLSSLNLEIYSYTETYTNDSGNVVPFIGPNDVIIAIPGQGRQIHGSVTLVNDSGSGYDTYAAKYVPYYDGDRRAQQVALTVYSRFLLAPSPWADEWACIKTMG